MPCGPIFRSYLVPSYATAKREEAEALDVLAQVLGGLDKRRSATGYLVKSLPGPEALVSGFAWIGARWACAVHVLGLSAGFALPALATTIERVTSPGGIEAWLVREPSCR